MKSEVRAHKAHLRLVPNRFAVGRQRRVKNEMNVKMHTQIRRVDYGVVCGNVAWVLQYTASVAHIAHCTESTATGCERAYDLTHLREILFTRLMLKMHEI